MKLVSRIFIVLSLAALMMSSAMAHEDQPPPVVDELGEITPGTGFEGRVVVDGAVIPGAKVYAYRSFADFIASEPFASSAVTGDDGKYELDLPKGSFYLVAKKRQDLSHDGPVREGDYFSFQGSNPITVNPGRYTHVGFSMLPFDEEVTYQDYDEEGAGALGGVVTLDGEPLDGVFVTLYVDTDDDLRGSVYASSPPTGKEGIFQFDYLPEVEYFVVARKRESGTVAGPLNDGDYFGFFPTNPVQVKSGKLAEVKIPLVTKAGEIGQEDSLFRSTGTKITGTIKDNEGKVVEGLYVFGYLDKVMAHKRPEYISKQVDENGYYELNFPKGGTYYIGARSSYGDTPALGEWYGRWEGTGNHSVVLETGQTLEHIDMIVERILP